MGFISVVICFGAQAGEVRFGPEDRMAYRDYLLYAGKPSPIYPELVRANRDGSCAFRLMQPHGEPGEDPYFRTIARIGEQIKEGESDFLGYLVACDASTNTATVRDFDMGRPRRPSDVANADPDVTHCAASETVVFSCRIAESTKVLSVCGSAHLAPGTGALSYRFGIPGKPESVFPGDAEGSPLRFRYAHYFRMRTDLTELSFANGGATYTVFDYYPGDEGRDEYERGLRVVTDAGKAETTLSCAGDVDSNLGMLEEIVPCDAENALTMGGCDGH